MKKIALLIGIPALLLLAACNQADGPPATQTQTASAAASTAKSPAQDDHAEHMGQSEASHEDHAEDMPAMQSGEPITLSSGEQVEVVGVAYFDENVKKLPALVAIEGRVKESHPDRGALILIDCSVEAGCKDGCCPEAEVPVRLDLSNYTGELPSADAEIVVVGDLTVLDMGYSLVVREIRQGDQTLLALNG